MEEAKTIKVLTIISWIFVLVWMGVIFMFSAQNSTQSSEMSGDISDTVYVIVEDTFPDADVTQESIEITTRNIAHFILYFILGVLVLNAFNLQGIVWPNASIYSLLVSVGYSLSDEWHQTFVPGRGFEIKDLIIDFCGAFIAILLLTMILELRRKRVA